MYEQPEDISVMVRTLIKEIDDNTHAPSGDRKLGSIDVPMVGSRVSALKDKLKAQGKDWKDVGANEEDAKLLDNILKAHESF